MGSCGIIPTITHLLAVGDSHIMVEVGEMSLMVFVFDLSLVQAI